MASEYGKRFVDGHKMKNVDVALAMVWNAKAYAKSGDMATVMHNLEYIEKLLENPNEDNPDHTWDDFK